MSNDGRSIQTRDKMIGGKGYIKQTTHQITEKVKESQRFL